MDGTRAPKSSSTPLLALCMNASAPRPLRTSTVDIRTNRTMLMVSITSEKKLPPAVMLGEAIRAFGTDSLPHNGQVFAEASMRPRQTWHITSFFLPLNIESNVHRASSIIPANAGQERLVER